MSDRGLSSVQNPGSNPEFRCKRGISLHNYRHGWQVTLCSVHNSNIQYSFIELIWASIISFKINFNWPGRESFGSISATQFQSVSLSNGTHFWILFMIPYHWTTTLIRGLIKYCPILFEVCDWIIRERICSKLFQKFDGIGSLISNQWYLVPN